MASPVKGPHHRRRRLPRLPPRRRARRARRRASSCSTTSRPGARTNVAHHLGTDEVELVEGSSLDATLVDDLVGRVDVVFHLASSVGVQLVVSNPLASPAEQRPRHGHRALGRRAARQARALHLDLGGLRQERQRRARRGVRPDPWLAVQVPLVLRDREVLRRGARPRAAPRGGRRDDHRPALQHRRPAPDRPLRHGAAALRAPGGRPAPTSPSSATGPRRAASRTSTTRSGRCSSLIDDDAPSAGCSTSATTRRSRSIELARRVIARSRLRPPKSRSCRTTRPTTRASRSWASASRTRRADPRADRLGARAHRRRCDRRRDRARARTGSAERAVVAA